MRTRFKTPDALERFQDAIRQKAERNERFHEGARVRGPSPRQMPPSMARALETERARRAQARMTLEERARALVDAEEAAAAAGETPPAA